MDLWLITLTVVGVLAAIFFLLFTFAVLILMIGAPNYPDDLNDEIRETNNAYEFDSNKTRT